MQVIQEVGDFVITPPFGLHSGFNTGKNAAFAANFGDIPWIEVGMYAPVCLCRSEPLLSKSFRMWPIITVFLIWFKIICFRDDQIRLNLVPILNEWRPDLLDKYLRGTSLDFPPGHPCNVLISSDASQQEVKPRSTSTSGAHNKKVSGRAPKHTRTSLRSRVLNCPKCPSKSYAENKMKRLINHIYSNHMTEKEKLLQIVESKYPKWTPKTQTGFKCQICGSFFRGSVSHVFQHHQKKHPDETFKREPLQ